MKCTQADCGKDVSTVDEVRGCSQCQRTGVASAIHAKYLSGAKIDIVVAEANPGAFPFVFDEPPAQTSARPLDHDDDGHKGGSLPKAKRKK